MNRAPNEFATGFLRTAGCFTFVVVLIAGLIGAYVFLDTLWYYIEHKARRSQDPPVQQPAPPEPEPEPLPKPAEPKVKPKVRPPVSKPGRPPIVISPGKSDEKKG
jgi:hypothetical protein